jgi:N-acyl-D-amino-acid deacylase
MGKYDILIKNGLVYNGTFDPPVKTDIAVKDGYITETGKCEFSGKEQVIDAGGLVVAPGFIDIHTHCDERIFKRGMNSLENFLTQGVTTVVTGNCGMGTFDTGKFFSELDKTGSGTNIVHLAGHNEIRKKVMGTAARKAGKYEIEEMKKLLSAAMEEGAAGMSTGLFYVPGTYSSSEELIELAEVVKKYGGFYASHIRDESDFTVGLEEAIKEAIYIGEKTGVRVQISHIKALGKSVWGMSPKICDMIEKARRQGICIFADQYPYNASSTVLSGAVMPAIANEGDKLTESLINPDLLSRIQKEIAENIERRGGAESLKVVSYSPDHNFDGKSLSEISRILASSVIDTVIYLVKTCDPYIISYNMKDSDIETFMKKDYVMTGSDGYIEVPGEGTPHPRCYGTFPRKIRKYVREEKIISLEHAIRAATSLPADMIGLKDRGYLKKGYAADTVIFDPEKITDNATYSEPHQYSSGIEYLLVNGQIVIENGEYNEKLPGKGLRHLKKQ